MFGIRTLDRKIVVHYGIAEERLLSDCGISSKSEMGLFIKRVQSEKVFIESPGCFPGITTITLAVTTEKNQKRKLSDELFDELLDSIISDEEIASRCPWPLIRFAGGSNNIGSCFCPVIDFVKREVGTTFHFLKDITFDTVYRKVKDASENPSRFTQVFAYSNYWKYQKQAIEESLRLGEFKLSSLEDLLLSENEVARQIGIKEERRQRLIRNIFRSPKQ